MCQRLISITSEGMRRAEPLQPSGSEDTSGKYRAIRVFDVSDTELTTSLLSGHAPRCRPPNLTCDYSPARLRAWNLVGHSEASVQRLTTPRVASRWVRGYRLILPWLTTGKAGGSEPDTDHEQLQTGGKAREAAAWVWFRRGKDGMQGLAKVFWGAWWVAKWLLRIAKAVVMVALVFGNLLVSVHSCGCRCSKSNILSGLVLLQGCTKYTGGLLFTVVR